jgi:4-hydroxy-4-methyl-2-oxoglutarate aldolase
MNAPSSRELLASLGRLDAPTVANAIETFDVRLRNEGFANNSIRCLFPQLPRLVGYAATVTIRGANPPVGAHAYVDRIDWWNYLLSVPAPRVLVVQDISSQPGLGALLGEVHVNILRALGCVGAVTNGAARDLPAIESLGFGLFTAAVSVSHSYVHLVDIGVPVQIAGMKVRSGDLLHGDLHGIQTIPAAIAPQLPATAARLQAVDDRLIAACQAPDFNLDRLRRALAQAQT